MSEDRMQGIPPESICQVCGGHNPVWFAPNEIWNAVVKPPTGIFCPSCFATLAEAEGINTTGWVFQPEEHASRALQKLRDALEQIVRMSCVYTSPPTEEGKWIAKMGEEARAALREAK